LRKVREELPFLRTVNGGGDGVVEVEPFVGCGRFAEQCVILERLFRVRSEAI
jgi:hypothetical protein